MVCRSSEEQNTSLESAHGFKSELSRSYWSYGNCASVLCWQCCILYLSSTVMRSTGTRSVEPLPIQGSFNLLVNALRSPQMLHPRDMVAGTFRMTLPAFKGPG
eukprot:662858-Rhodomonas_salina.2